MGNEIVIYDSEILFIYDAKMCNPNGDPDEENKPRMDYVTSRNLVSDVRLKRYIRDYFISKNKEIWVSKVEDEVVDATKRLGALAEKYENEKGKKVDIKKPDDEFINWLKEQLIDVRLFGATMPLKGGEGERGGGLTFTGPVQFTWGYSLNPVEIIPSSSITSHFAGRGEEYGTIGKDWRVYYSLIAFYGIISKRRAEKTGLSTDDVKQLDNALIEAIPSEATTRSKLGQIPRLVLRIEYKSGTYIGDLRRYITIKPQLYKSLEAIRDVDDFELDITSLINIINKNLERIESICFWKHEDLKILGDFNQEGLKNKIKNLPHN